MRAARHAEVGGQSMAGGPAQRRAGGPICQAGHAAPKLGRNIRLVTRNKGCGQPWTGRAFEIPIRDAFRLSKVPLIDSIVLIQALR